MRDINERSNSRYSDSYYNNHYYNNHYHNSRYNKENKLNKYSNLKTEYLHFKLSDLINSNSSFVIDNLYAQFQSDSKQISLFYVPPMEQADARLPENSFLLSAKLLFDSLNRTRNLTDTTTTSANSSVNLLLNEFYLLAAKSQSNYNTSSMDSYYAHRLQISEIFLILFVISLWFISIVFCVRRSSLVLCFHKRDVPFYDSSKEKKKSNLSMVKSITITSCAAAGAATAASATSPNNIIENELQLLQQQKQNLQQLQQDSLCSCQGNATLTRDDSKLDELLLTSSEPLDQSTVIDMKILSIENSHTDSSFANKNNDSFCSRCNKKTPLTKHFSYSSTNENNNEITSKSASDTYVYNQLSESTNIHTNNNVQQSKSLHYNPKILLDKLQYSKLYDADCEYYYSNGILYSTKQRSASVLLNKATRTKFSKTERLNRMMSMTSNSNTSNTNSSIKYLFNNTSNYNNNNSLIFESKQPQTVVRPAKISSFAKQHFNLVSLDEEALLSYNKQHKFIKKQQNPASTNALSESQRSSYISKKLNKNLTSKQGKLSLAMPSHVNFISLRSGSVTSSQGTYFLKSGISDDDNFESAQNFRPPSTLNQQPNSRSRSSSLALNNSSAHNSNIQMNQTTSQRPTNPLSMLRRHMFANSHRKTTKANQTLSFFEDSTNLSYETANSCTSNNQLSANNIQNGTNLSSEIIREDSYCSIPDNMPANLMISAQVSKDPNLLDPHYINPDWIPEKVKECLLELHKDTKSQSDSNIKFRNRSSNQLLHSYGRNGRKEALTKKPLSLQNSQEKPLYYNSSSHRNSVIVNFYDEIKNKLFQNKSSVNTNNSNTTTTSTSLSLANNNSTNQSEHNDMANVIFRNSPSTIFDEPSKELFSESDKSLGS